MSDDNFEVIGPGKVRGVFRDASAVGRLTGWDLGFRQLDPGPQAIAFRIAAGKRVNLMHMRFNCSFHQLGAPPSSSLTFGLPVQGMNDWHGRTYDGASILPFNGLSGIDGVSRPGFEALTMSVAEDWVRHVADAYELQVPGYLHSGLQDYAIPDSDSVQKMRHAADYLVRNSLALLDEDAEESLVVELLSAALVDRPVEEKSSPAARARTLSKALEYLDSHKREALTVGELCSSVRVAWRTLDRAFKERFGLGPKAYMLKMRLTGVRNELLTCDTGTIIADIANGWGFWHMGQLARDYRKLFGELPSSTVRRASASQNRLESNYSHFYAHLGVDES